MATKWNHQYVGQADSGNNKPNLHNSELLLFIFMVSNSFVRRGMETSSEFLHLLNKAAVKLTGERPLSKQYPLGTPEKATSSV